ncbi:MAG: hypothetical protein FD124_3230, partial [Alphaproteobacteria bacterium]
PKPANRPHSLYRVANRQFRPKRSGEPEPRGLDEMFRLNSWIPDRDFVASGMTARDAQGSRAAPYPLNGSRIRITSSRSGLVLTSAAGQEMSSSMRRMYLIALAGRSREVRTPWVDSVQPGIVS